MFVLQNAPAAEPRACRASRCARWRSDTARPQVRPRACPSRSAGRASRGVARVQHRPLRARPRSSGMVGHLRDAAGGASSPTPSAPVADAAAADARTSASSVLRGLERTRGRLPARRRASTHLFEAQVARTPGRRRRGARGDERSPTRQLDARANQLAHHLRALGRRAGGARRPLPGALAGDGGGLLGILKAGGAYVPLDPRVPARAPGASCCEDAGVRGAAHPGARWPTLPVAGAARACCLDAERAQLARQPDADPDRGAAARGHLAYVIYTSGSTGRPKGVLLAHRGPVQHGAGGRARHWRFGAGSRVLQFASLRLRRLRLRRCSPRSWPARPLVPRAAGGAAARARRSQALLRDARASPPSRLTPSVLAQLEPEALPALADDRLRGRGVPAGAGAALERRAAAFLNAYGPTEATVCATHQRREVDPRSGPPSAGRCATCEVYVLDARCGRCRSACRASCTSAAWAWRAATWAAPELTAERFVPDPFGDDARRAAVPHRRPRALPARRRAGVPRPRRRPGEGARLPHRAGRDRGRAGAAPRGAATRPWLLREDAPGDKRLVAYVVPAAKARWTPAALRAAPARSGCPSTWCRRPSWRWRALPLTPSGKVDRRALPAPEAGRRRRRRLRGARAPSWSSRWPASGRSVLRVERGGPGRHFFELGGNSLPASRSTTRLRSRAGARGAAGRSCSSTPPSARSPRGSPPAAGEAADDGRGAGGARARRGARASTRRAAAARADGRSSGRRDVEPRSAGGAWRSSAWRVASPAPRTSRRSGSNLREGVESRHPLHRRGAGAPPGCRTRCWRAPGYVRAGRRADGRASSSTPPSSASAPREAEMTGPAAPPLPGVRVGGAGARGVRPRALPAARSASSRARAQRRTCYGNLLRATRSWCARVGGFQAHAGQRQATSWPPASPTSSTCAAPR